METQNSGGGQKIRGCLPKGTRRGFFKQGLSEESLKKHLRPVARFEWIQAVMGFDGREGGAIYRVNAER